MARKGFTGIMKRHVGYIVYNVLYQLFCFWLLLLFGTYYNGLILPDSEQENMVLRFLIMLLEATVLVAMIYLVNNAVLSDIENKRERHLIAMRTLWTNIIACIGFLLLMILN